MVRQGVSRSSTEHAEVVVSRNSLRIHLLWNHQCILKLAGGEMPALSGPEQGFLQQRTAVHADPARLLLRALDADAWMGERFCCCVVI